ncbi:hypothetical protein [Aliikangiella sp. G2MR2-5]|uniref:hypothetical protein n=1 Tax=Aliikangiella sp. G2MR2-5 TaxID=2788943 RepID=UPI0018A927BF|nr:hypothetical protein [Aliikangiella sp. G2MR2-5]
MEIASNEKNQARGFYILSAIFGLITCAIFYIAIQPASKSGVWFAAFLFLIFALLFLFFAKFYQKKYEKLGATPLFIDELPPNIGELMTGKISVARPNFKKAKEVSLANIRYHGGNKNSQYDVLCSTKSECKLRFEKSATWLDFEIEIPSQGRASGRERNINIYWELSIAYTEDLSLVKRSWRITVNPAKEKFNFQA